MRLEHTPTPWKVGRDNSLFPMAGGKRSWVIAQMAQCRTDKAGQANAAFIVRACNSHEELVKALEWALLFVEQSDEAEISKWGGESLAHFRKDMEQARAALAKASK